MPTSDVPPIHRLLAPSRVQVGLAASTKEGVLDALVATLGGHPAVHDVERVRAAVHQREQVMSTGVGKGLGLPHAKTDAAEETLAAFAITAAPVPFGAIDNQPVRLVFLLVGPEGARSQHIKILSRLSRLMNRDAFRQQLLQAKTPEAVLHHFETGELDLVDS